MGFVIREERRRERVDDGFAGAIPQGKEQHADGEADVRSIFPVLREHISRGECHHCGSGVQNERHEHELAIAEEIRTEAEEDDRQAEAEQPAPCDCAEFALRETELLAPILENGPAHREADACGDEREKAGPEQNFFVLAVW